MKKIFFHFYRDIHLVIFPRIVIEYNRVLICTIFSLSIYQSVLLAQLHRIIEIPDNKGYRLRPVKPILLESAALSVAIDRATGLPYNYNIHGNNIWGEDSGHKINAVICRLKPRDYLSIPTVPNLIKATAKEADLLFNTFYKGQPAASFHVRYILDGSTLIITMEDVNEHCGYQLIETLLPNLVTVREEDGPGWLAHGMGGGAVVELKHAKAYHLPDDGNFGRIGFVLPVAMVGTGKSECVMEVSAFMDGTEIEITGENGHHHARIGTLQTYRVHGGRSYNMNDGNPPNKGAENTPNLIVGQTPRCRLDFLSDMDGISKVDWLDGAKLVAGRMPLIPTTYFNDKFVYLVGGKYKTENEPRTTFAQGEKLIRDIAMLTDFAPQLALISGWVYAGQDTGFPSEDSVNQSMGGPERLNRLLTFGPKYNTNISFNTNYDDAYKSSPVFDTAWLARRPDGGIWRSRDWDGEYSYITGMAKYMVKAGMKRIDYMMDRYKIHDAVMIDAMSWFSIRNDWDPQHPASGYRNLVEGKYKIIQAFGKKGVHVISEQLRYPFIGRLALSADGSGGGICPFGGEPVPLLATIYRKSAIWGAGDFDLNEVQKNLFWNCRPLPWFINVTDREKIADYYYMTVLPFDKVHNRSIETYERKGYQSVIGLGNGSTIQVDWMNLWNYNIEIDGIRIAGDDATFCPVDNERVAFFARSAKELTAALPAGWDASKIQARSLFIDHREVVPVAVKNGMIMVSVNAGTPVMVYRDATRADRPLGIE